MSEENAPITVTLKGGPGYEAPWLVIRGNRPEEVSNMLRSLGDLPEVVSQTAQLFAGTVAAGPIIASPPEAPQQQPQAAWGTINPQQGGFVPAQQGQTWQSGQQAQPQQQAAPAIVYHPEGKSCPRDNKTLVYKEVFSKAKQKTFKFWTCPDQRSRDDGHESIFAD